jgi:hypothetical protein
MRDQSSLEVVDVPIPDPIPDQFAVSVLPRADWIVNQAKLGAKARDSGSDAGSVILGTAWR